MNTNARTTPTLLTTQTPAANPKRLEVLRRRNRLLGSLLALPLLLMSASGFAMSSAESVSAPDAELGMMGDDAPDMDELAPIESGGSDLGDDSVTGPVQPTTKLEDDASAWSISIQGAASWTKGNVADPSIDGKALKLTMSNAQSDTIMTSIRETGARSNLGSYSYTAGFQVRDNQALGSPVQDSFSLGFVRVEAGSVSKVYVRWIPEDSAGKGVWYVYDPNASGEWRSLNIRSTLQSGVYYSLSFDVTISCTQVQYRKLVVSGTSYSFNTASGMTVSPGEPSRVQAACLTFANGTPDSFSLYVDTVSIASKSTKAVVCNSP